MTTGGGWQDQVNGVLPGFKIGTSSLDETASLAVKWEPIKVSEEFRTQFEERVFLIYTGTVRLAKNLLQVIKDSPWASVFSWEKSSFVVGGGETLSRLSGPVIQ